MLVNRLVVVQKLLHGVGLVSNGHRVGYERMPVIEMGEFDVDAIVPLELLTGEQVRLVGESQVVLTEVSHVVFDGDFQTFSEDDELGRLVETFVVPLRVLLDQNIANAIVLADPHCLHDQQSRQHTEKRMS